MEEVSGRDGTWVFDLDSLRIVPGKGAHEVRQALGQVVIPLAAIAGVTYEPGRKNGRLRLRLRAGADPLMQVTGGHLGDSADPYQLTVDNAWSASAAYLAETVHNALLVNEIPESPSDEYLLPGPPVPQVAEAGDGTATFDGTHVRLEWNWMAEGSKTAAGTRRFVLTELSGVDWRRQSGFGYGYLRFRVTDEPNTPSPEYDPNCLAWGIKKEGGTTALLAAAVVARLPHPFATQPAQVEPAAAEPAAAADPDALLRRLRELGDLHRDGVLTDEEFTAAKRVLLERG